MIHFSSEQWFEFARNAEPAEEHPLMERHLEDGCDECRKVAAMWTEVLEIAARESRYHLPAGVVRSARAAFAPRGNWRWLTEIAQAAETIFDSMLEPIPAAVRGSAAPARQFLQEAKPFVVDLRVEFEPILKRVRLVGQVLSSTEPQKIVSDVDVFLLRGEQLAANTTANSSGEFELEFEAEENLQLFVDIRGRKVIEVRLPVSFETGKE